LAQRAASARAPASAGEARHRGATTYAHVNFWYLTDAGATSDNSAARAVAAALREQPGFRMYMLIRTGTGGVQFIVVSVFDSQPELEAATDAVAPIIREHVTPLATEKPERHGGEVLYYLAV
jgi:hypothetical protein